MTIASAMPDVGVERAKLNSIVFAGCLGTIIEWYDFLIYASAAALVFNKAFFPTFDPLAGTLAALGSYAVGFLARPLGGALFGHFGDRLGRKSMLVATLFIMSLSTFCIGLLPTYASIGVLAPILLILLRIIQGIGLGGEWGGASLLVLEHAPADRRGFYTSFVQVGFPIGLVLATLAFTLATKLPDADFATYGWRIPFLVSIVLLAVGTFVRLRVPETPVFEALRTSKGLSANPVGEAVSKNARSFFIAVGLKLSEVSWVYLLTVFVVGYATTKLSLPKAMMLDAVLYAALVELVSVPAFGFLSDKIGRRPLYILGALFTIAFAFPLFWMLESKSTALIFTAIVIAMNFGHGMMFAPESCYFPELFGPNVRYSGASFGFQVSAAIGGGFAPIIATAMVGYLGGTTGVSIMMIGLALITLTAALAARETKGGSLMT
ncbi:MFS transporter [Bradyrhizobium sp. LTSPM299]|uniref:MFS transporter n=1 Tax=Bradyrhizobium sp. LTSPM299 TaxID=1619233 RepID=UPI0005CAC289|nr:MFS transporter [Bradyrhizobium sp. LTSPM299]KJC61028.1 MFS transporter [Bradyrhizobium sp. LTSPM299]